MSYSPEEHPHGHAQAAGLFRLHYAELVRYACKFVELHTAEDMVQDVFIQLHGKIPDNARSYLFRSVYNKCLDHLRRQEVHKKFLASQEMEFFHPDTGQKSLLEDATAGIWQAIEQLPPKCREIVKLRYQQGLKPTEISDAMGISSRTVETQLYKGIRTLRGLVRKLNYCFSFLF
ncbi:sigma-70 family RNA polymerase sigma factor [Chitinophaga sedimenti]|uniref:sigma-70 family RNA polymerase sigma factor n=1 Tax=Chitinophaga sedimenti TaxID=2033606 RepID=UPI002002AFC4|nr:sigma-70 family RNA polymerase sigma factor [Chitinophaga sedimenti]MCK7559804.1 sigma-70 family RNA polymerase sigma factor [Chitinophaga sedimenti]